MSKRECLGDFERRVLPHLDVAYNLARWLVRDPPAAEDVVQDAFLRALKYFASSRGGSERAWLLQIVRNVAYSHLRAQQARLEVSLSSATGTAEEEEGVDTDIPDPDPDPEATLLRRQELGQIDKALDALPVALRECLVLRELDELSYKEIARITGVPIGTVMSRLSRARQALQKGVINIAGPAAPCVPGGGGPSRTGGGLSARGLVVF
jgi:RNA polymerase sigma-70 factor, ECF subfamily